MRDNIVYGRQTVREFLRAENTPRVNRIYLSESFPNDLRSQVLALGASFQELPRRELDRMFPDIHHQGVVLELAGSYRAAAPDTAREALELGGPFLALDDVSDPQNLGSILRTAEALGVRAVFAGSKTSPVTPAVHRASSGASMHIPVYNVGNLAQFVERMRESGIWMVASVPDETAPTRAQTFLRTTDSDELPEADKLCLMIGSEGTGLKSILIDRADYLMTIPMHGKTASLNAGVACGIMLERMVNR